ncbi:MAG: hypothetical protein ACR2G1_09020 [Rubrobacteraceae bacterium]
MFSRLFFLGALLCLPGGVLWALSPLGVYLTEMRFGSSDTFWRLFPSSVVLICAGLVSHRLRGAGRGSRLAVLGFYVVLLGAVLVVVGVGLKFYLGLDDVYLFTAPGWHALRVGIFVVAAGSWLFAVGGLRSETLPHWVGLPLAFGSAFGALAAVRDLGYVGVVLWIVFGLAWAWMGLAPIVEVAARYWGGKRLKTERRSSRG